MENDNQNCILLEGIIMIYCKNWREKNIKFKKVYKNYKMKEGNSFQFKYTLPFLQELLLINNNDANAQIRKIVYKNEEKLVK